MLRVQLVGDMLVWVDDVVIDPPASRRAWSLLAWLALQPGQHSRSEVAAAFWPDVLDSSARASLRSALWALRRALGNSAEDYLSLERERLGLRSDADIRVDVREIEALAAAGRTADAVDLGAAVLLPGFDDEWVIEAREAYRPKIMAMLETLAMRADEVGDAGAAVDWTRRQIGLDPLAEEPLQALMRRLAASGDRAAAMAAYKRFRDKLSRELQIAPSQTTSRLADELHSATHPTAMQAVAPTQDWALIGRDRELTSLKAAWREARKGRSVVAMVTGEPGIGKTRLASELLDLARAAGAVVADATAVDLGMTSPFGMWAELIGGLAASVKAPPPEAVWPHALAPLAPELEARLGRMPAAPARSSPDLERTRLYEATVGLLQWASHDRPVVLLMDDVQNADLASLDLIGYACRRLARSPILMILTRRPLPHRVDVDTLEQSLRAQRILSTEIELEPLTAEHSAHLAREVAVLPEAQIDQVVVAAEGNALLTVEWTAALARGQSSPPNSLRAAVRTALVPLQGDARELALLAAIAGRTLERDEVESLPLSSPREAMTAAAECSLLTTARGRIGYRHALLREAAYVDLSEPLRERLHEQFGQLLAGMNPRVAAEAARHLRLAGRNDLAVGQLVRAADHARAVAALAEAAAILSEALALEPGNSALMVDLAEVEAFRGEASASDDSFEHAIASMEDPAEVAEAWVRRATWYGNVLCNPRNALDAARHAVRVMDTAEIEAPELRIEALAMWSWAESVAGDVDRANLLLEEVHAILGPRRASDLLIPAIGHARSFALLRRGRFQESYPPEIAAAEAAKRLGRPDLSYGAWVNAACAASCAGEFDRALEFVDRGLVDVVGTGLDSLEFHLLAGRSHVLARLGREEDALEAAAAQRAIAERLGSKHLLSIADHDAGLLALRLDHPARAAELLGAALEQGAAVSRPIARLHRAEALVATGRHDEAEEELRLTALEPMSPGDMPETLVPRLTSLQGLIARGRGDEDRARSLLEDAAAGWRRVIDRRAQGEQFVATLADFGRPPVVGLVEPTRELERVLANLQAPQPAPT
ncbi:MAG: transcriptional activator domain [Marmoricola sp.]|nr:transcriptional activator domain [Marmoricola sp.]